MTMPDVAFSDEARRCSEVMNLHTLAGKAGRWAAIRLSDGGSDGIAYDQRRDAIRHQLHERQCAYIQVNPGGMTPSEAERFMRFVRAVYDSGRNLADPEVTYVMPIRLEHLS